MRRHRNFHRLRLGGSGALCRGHGGGHCVVQPGGAIPKKRSAENCEEYSADLFKRNKAYELLVPIPDIRAVNPELEKTLPGITDPTEKAGVYYALVRLGEPKHIKTIAAILDNRNADKETRQRFRRIVLSALGELGAVETADKIARYLDDDDPSNAAFLALPRISLKDKETCTKPHSKHGKHRIKRLFLLSQ